MHMFLMLRLVRGRSARCNVAVVENDAQLQKLLSVRERLPHLRAIVQYRGPLTGHYANCYTVGGDVATELLQI